MTGFPRMSYFYKSMNVDSVVIFDATMYKIKKQIIFDQVSINFAFAKCPKVNVLIIIHATYAMK